MEGKVTRAFVNHYANVKEMVKKLNIFLFDFYEEIQLDFPLFSFAGTTVATSARRPSSAASLSLTTTSGPGTR